MSYKPKQAGGLKPEERHQIVLDYLKEINKPSTVFHLRWSEPALLTKKVLITTPAFWYLKYGWKRKMVENMFFKAQIEVDATLEKAFDQVFGGGYTGERWRDTAMRGKLDNLWEKLHGQKKDDNGPKKKGKKQSDDAQDDDSNIQLNVQQFIDALKINNVNISADLAQNIFNQIDVNKNGFITKAEMDQLLTKLDALDFGNITDLANNPEMLNLCMTKKVMDCLLSDEGLQFVETEFLAHLTTSIEFNDPEAFTYLNKLGDRDIGWEERIFAMTQLNKGIESGKYDGILRDDNLLRQLLFGIAAQLLDENQNVQSKAVEILPNLLDECFNKANLNVVYEHLPEILDNLFLILDNPKCKMSHDNVRFGIDEIIDNIINTQHPVAALQLAKIFAGKCDLENVNNADTRNYGLQCLSKIMFSLDSPYLEFDVKQVMAPKVDPAKLPKEGDPYREWLDTATSHQPGPSVRYMNQNAGNQSQQERKHRSGSANELVLGYGKSAYGSGNQESEEQGDDDQKEQKEQALEDKQLTEYTSEEIGTEFVDAVSNGLSSAMMDPNRRNKIHAFKTNNILNQLQPEFSKNLDGESKRRYDQWQSGDQKPYSPMVQDKPLPSFKKIDPKLVAMNTTTKQKVNFKPSLPDI